MSNPQIHKTPLKISEQLIAQNIHWHCQSNLAKVYFYFHGA